MNRRSIYDFTANKVPSNQENIERIETISDVEQSSENRARMPEFVYVPSEDVNNEIAILDDVYSSAEDCQKHNQNDPFLNYDPMTQVHFSDLLFSKKLLSIFVLFIVFLAVFNAIMTVWIVLHFRVDSVSFCFLNSLIFLIYFISFYS